MARRKPIPVTHRQSPYAPPSDEQIALARRMYEERFTVSRILSHCDMSLGTLYHWLDGGPREDGAPLLPPLPRRRVVVGQRRRPLRNDYVSMLARLYRTAERQARDIEHRLAQPTQPPAARERDIRMLAILVKTLRDLSLVNVQGSAQGPQHGPDAPPGEAVAAQTQPEMPQQDAQSLRRDLGRRLDALIAQAQAAHPDAD